MKNEAADGVLLDDAAVDDAAMLGQLAGIEPGPFSMMILAGIDPASLDDDGRVDYAHAWDRQQAWVTAQAQRALAAVMLAEFPPRVSEMVEEAQLRTELVAATLRWSTATAGNRLDTACRLVSVLPATHALLAAGEISFRHASILADATDLLDPATTARVEARVLGRAPEQTPAAFRKCVWRAILAADPHAAQIRNAQAVAERNVRQRPGADGMSTLVATLPAADAETVCLALDAVARKAAAADDDVTIGIDARRADALVGWALAALADPTLPKQHGRPVELRLTMDLPSALGLAENPAELAHYGSIPASVARILIADANWRRFVTEPITGALLDYGRTVYRPPQALADYLIARDRTCRFPGCSMAAERCDLDHGCPYEKGGHTSSHNCHPLCRRHHLLKTFGGRALESHGNGAVTWTAPNGQQFDVPPENHNPDD